MSHSISPRIRRDWDFSKEAEDELNEILFRYVFAKQFRAASFNEDVFQCTDVKFQGSDVRIAQRVRRVSNTKNRRDFTLRLSVRSGAKTEIDKIEQHTPSIYVYAWVDGESVVEWVAVDIQKFILDGLHKMPQQEKKTHSDGNTFGCWSIEFIQDRGCLIAGAAKIGQPIWMRWVPSLVYLKNRDARLIAVGHRDTKP